MIELFGQNIRTNRRQSSKGNQLKWENDGIWYKADYTGYEVPSSVLPVALRNVIFPHDLVFYTGFYTNFLQKNYETASLKL